MTAPQHPAEGLALVESLAGSLHALYRVRYAHIQLRLLLEANESQFFGRALDELADAEAGLDTVETTRARAAAEAARAAGLRDDSDIVDLMAVASDGVRHALFHLRATIQDVLAATNAERASARRLSHTRVVNRPSGERRQV